MWFHHSRPRWSTSAPHTKRAFLEAVRKLASPSPAMLPRAHAEAGPLAAPGIEKPTKQAFSSDKWTCRTIWQVTVIVSGLSQSPVYAVNRIHDCAFSLPLSRLVVDVVAGWRYNSICTPHMTASHSGGAEELREVLREAHDQVHLRTIRTGRLVMDSQPSSRPSRDERCVMRRGGDSRVCGT